MWKLQQPPSPQDMTNILVIREFSAEKLKMCFAKNGLGNQLVYEKFWLFHATQGGLHTALFSVPRLLKGKLFTMSGALGVLQMKAEDVLKFLAAGTHLGGTNFDFQMEQYIYKRKSDGSYIINLREPGRSFCWQLGPLCHRKLS
uniref:Uncharacterized protein n=1 Tax=Pipistrellus kuhlii TaxID=59472 RepID=A0A7J7VV72_PIPKU|nr:hypothetical protein mPipKuh1_008270 [Pipistrellus kuhlii]